MSTKDRRNREKELRRQVILNSAKKIFLLKGIEKSTMSDIADDCELARGTIYLYFKNKNELVLSLLLMKLKHLAKYLEQNLAFYTNCLEKILRFYKALYLFYKENPIYLHLANYWDYFKVKDYIDQSSLVYQKVVKEDTKIMQGFLEIFNEGIARNEIRKVEDSLKYLIATDGALIGLIKLCITREEGIEEVFKFSSESVVDTYIKIIRNDLLAK